MAGDSRRNSSTQWGVKRSAGAVASLGQVVGLLGVWVRWETGCQSPGTRMESKGGEWG